MPVVRYQRGRDFPGPRAFLALPTGSGAIEAPCVASLMEAMTLLTSLGVAADFCIEAGNCHVDDARNSLVREFLKTDCTDLVFIDADVGFRSEDLVRLIGHDADVVAGVYPKKEDAEDFPVFASGLLQADAAGLVEVVGAPTGFMRIRRRVLEALAAQAESFIGQAGDPVPYHVIFERLIGDGRRWSGDYAFCRKWRALGGRIHVDPEMAFSHTGPKTWGSGRTLGDFWKDKYGVTAQIEAQRFAEALAACKSGAPPKAEHFMALAAGWGNPWAASPELLGAAWRFGRGRVLECGSGLTTLVMACAGAEVTALEHDPVWASYTRAMLERHGVAADIRCAPLVDGWYDHPGGDFDAVIVDGPPRQISDRRAVFDRARAPVFVWDDYDGQSLPGEIVAFEGEKPFAVLRFGKDEVKAA